MLAETTILDLRSRCGFHRIIVYHGTPGTKNYNLQVMYASIEKKIGIVSGNSVDV